MKSKQLINVNNKIHASSSILVSNVMKIEKKIDYLPFFAENASFKGNRFFWKDPLSENVLIGLGCCKEILLNQQNNLYSSIEEEWMELLKNSQIYNEYNDSGVGPTLFGGFTFDPQKPKTKLWDHYADAHFFVPSFMLSEINGTQYITTNMLFENLEAVSLHEVKAKTTSLLKKTRKQSSQKNKNYLVKSVEIDGKQWKKTVDNVVNDLNTTLKKVVLARECRLVFEQDIKTEAVLENLLKQQENSYIFALESEDNCFIGASPERLVKKINNEVFSTCLAGSITREKSKERDQQLGEQLLHDRKNRIEHQYVVNMIKSAMEEVCKAIEIPSHPHLLKMRDIQHLYTPVKGILKESESLLSLIQLLHPTPALGGYPKNKAIEKIREEELLDRGLYGAPLGWLNYNGDGEFAVSIRSGLIQKNEASIFAGCGIVASSDAESEYKETTIKFKPMLSALGGDR
ncbi:isochorismate synthase [Niallia sp. 01092]|uniref:isochorismate synthase n=1 Tax=unclassified Niallia TaxID=2837522 RepID=UPI003FD032D3